MGDLPNNLLRVFQRIAPIADKIGGNLEVRGFHVTYIDRFNQGDFLEVAHSPIGDPTSPYGGPEGIRNFSNEKAFRLLAHRIRDEGAITSWQSAQPKLGMYQGAVAFPGKSKDEFKIISASAYAASLDEAVVLLATKEAGYVSDSFISRVVALTENETYRGLHDIFYGK